MRLPRPQFTARRMMVAVVILGLFLGGLDASRVRGMASKYRRKAESAARLERRCRQIDAMDPATRAREAEAAYDNPLLDDPNYNRRMIRYFAAMRIKYNHAADNPRLPIPPDPPQR